MRVPKKLVLCAAATVFLFGGVNLFPCAAGAETAQESKKSCHNKASQEHHKGKSDKKKEKPCCSLHCYNPAHIEPLLPMLPPAIVSIAVVNEEVPFLSLVFSPPLPPPRYL
ncbi:MAG: hypothetical protein KF713_04715 [Turneriella sp.]|nr:hypothetical protein [Turneriella sp.]